MIFRIGSLLYKIRSLLSRTHCAARLLGFTHTADVMPQPGIILLQIDGLSYAQLERSKNRTPFISRMVADRAFHPKPFYSGFPSTTPAVQAELFYGCKSAVPAFQFLKRDCNRQFTMYDPAAADYTAALLEQTGDPLLAGGRSYSNIYRGGAEQARYCIQTMKLSGFFREVHPVKGAVLLCLYAGKLLRVAAFAGVELCLAIMDCVRGVIKRKNIIKELSFIASRVGVVVVLRELIRFRVKLDVISGAPIIHANFIGYDEHAHRRGPDSAFARWTLKGIDNTIEDIHAAAMRSRSRDYCMIIYSDHGQEATDSYDYRRGETIHQAVERVFSHGPLSGVKMHETDSLPFHPHKYYQHKNLLTSGAGRRKSREGFLVPGRYVVTDMGPVCNVYIPFSLSDYNKRYYAEKIVRQAGVPLVLTAVNGDVLGVTRTGAYRLSDAPEKILGAGHPFLDVLPGDIRAAFANPDTGDFMLLGWAPGERPVSFAIENGSHGGPGPNETRGFVLLPRPEESGAVYVRPMHLRHIVMDILGRHPAAVRKPGCRICSANTVRVLTYNIHSCIGMNRQVFPKRIARVIDSLEPDVIALQEVDKGQRRSGWQDQAAALADYLEMEHRFFPLIHGSEGEYGLAMLSRLPVEEVRCGVFDANRPQKEEPRGAMWMKVTAPRGEIHCINTHLSLYPNERRRQVDTLMGRGWLGAVPAGAQVILCGDMNGGPRSYVYQKLSSLLRDVQADTAHRMPRGTFFSGNPVMRIDHIFVSHHFDTRSICVPGTREARIASDHLPVLAELFLNT